MDIKCIYYWNKEASIVCARTCYIVYARAVAWMYICVLVLSIGVSRTHVQLYVCVRVCVGDVLASASVVGVCLCRLVAERWWWCVRSCARTCYTVDARTVAYACVCVVYFSIGVSRTRVQLYVCVHACGAFGRLLFSGGARLCTYSRVHCCSWVKRSFVSARSHINILINFFNGLEREK